MLATVQYGLYAPSGGEIDHLHGHSRLYIAVYTALSRKWLVGMATECRVATAEWFGRHSAWVAPQDWGL